MSESERFEDWAEWLDLKLFSLEPGVRRYVEYDTELAWNAWMAAVKKDPHE